MGDVSGTVFLAENGAEFVQIPGANRPMLYNIR